MISLIANIGIQMFTFPIKFDPQDNVKMFFHEWLDPEKLFEIRVSTRYFY